MFIVNVKILKKSGFTLIELMIVISIISVIFSFSLIKFNGFNSLKDRIYVDELNNKILSFIVKSKMYCKDRDSSGYIRFDQNNNNIIYYNNLTRVYKMNLPEEFKLSINTEDNKVHINNDGMIQNAFSIKFQDGKGEMHCITVNVGTFYADIKY
nr:prepilin-type N-terminal cleavage/methylation domain-containing protein [Clostridium tyrobutyricum]